MPFTINHDLLTRARNILFKREKLFWVVGGAGSGKTTICQALSTRYALPVYDMDAHIYGTYHTRFTPERHPVNRQWSTAPDGLAWLLAMSWDEFDGFNRAALPEYLDLLSEDLADTDPSASLLIDGGICNPALIAGVIPPSQVVCLATPPRPSVEVWEGNEERFAMKAFTDQLPKPEEAWQKFLEFDRRITQTILQECRENQLAVCVRTEAETVDEFAGRVAQVLGIRSDRL